MPSPTPFRRALRCTALPAAAALLLATAAAQPAGAQPVAAGPPVLAEGVTSVVQAPVANAAAKTLPPGFTDELVAVAPGGTTAFAFLPDGRTFIADKSGVVRVLNKDGVVLDQPLLDISAKVNDYGDRGLLGLAVDPDFGTAGGNYVYLAYTMENKEIYTDTKTSRLSRFAVTGDVADVSSEKILLGSVEGSKCGPPDGRDCLPSDSETHSVGDLKFAADKSLFFSMGEGASPNTTDPLALRSQSMESLGGKLLRIDRATGAGLPDNPFFIAGNAGAVQSKVWAYGLRNPFRFDIRPGSGVPYVGDVGWHTWEEVNSAPARANLGWPCYEGENRQSAYGEFAECQALYKDGGARPPLLTYPHDRGRAVTSGAFYDGTSFPASYQGAYFFGDYSGKFIDYVTSDGSDQRTGGPTPFADGVDAGSPVDLDVGADGSLYYLGFSGDLRRISYGSTVGPRVVVTTPRAGATGVDSTTAVTARTSVPLDPGSVNASTVTLTKAGAAVPATVSYDVKTEAATLLPTAVLDLNGVYTATVKGGPGGVKDTSGRALAGDRVWSFTVSPTPGTNARPVVAVVTPTKDVAFQVGQVISYEGVATDEEDGPLGGEQLAWKIVTQHCPNFGTDCHAHDLTKGTGTSGSFTVPDHGDGFHFDITLTATDRAGASTASTVTINPQTSQITFRTNPAGLQVVWNGTPAATTPFTRTAIVGANVQFSALTPQDGKEFTSWSDGGARQHTVLIGAQDVTYEANFGGATTPPGGGGAGGGGAGGGGGGGGGGGAPVPAPVPALPVVPASPTPAASTPSAPTVAPSAPTTPAPAASCLPKPVLTMDRATIVATGVASATVRAAAGSTVDLFAYSQPATTYRLVRSGVVGASGSVAFGLRPPTNTRLYAQVRGCTADPRVDSQTLTVRTSLSLAATRTGPLKYTFSGAAVPGRPGGVLVSVYRIGADGRLVMTGQARADAATGRWSLSRTFTGTGLYGFVARTGGDLVNAAGTSSVRPTLLR